MKIFHSNTILGCMILIFLQSPAKAADDENNFFIVRSSFLYTTAKFDIYSEKHWMNLYGVRVEGYRGYTVPSLKGLEYGFSVSFMQLQLESKFQADIDPTSAGEYKVPFEIRPIISGAVFMARAGYTFDFGFLSIGLEFGAGIASIYQQIDWDYEDPDNSAVMDGGLERKDAVKYAFDWGLKVAFQVSEHNRLGIFGRMLSIPLYAPLDGKTTDYGPYQIYPVWEIGLMWQVLF